jgi:hypothetical protein
MRTRPQRNSDPVASDELLHERQISRNLLGFAALVGYREIAWPSGQVDRLTNLPVDWIVAVKEGAGIVPRPFQKAASR